MRRLVGPALAALACAVGAAGCGGQPAAAEPFGVALQVADCQDWRDSSPQERQSAIDQLERTVEGPRKEASALDDDVAYATLDSRCKPDFASGFLLYQLYIRAAAFKPPTE